MTTTMDLPFDPSLELGVHGLKILTDGLIYYLAAFSNWFSTSPNPGKSQLAEHRNDSQREPIVTSGQVYSA